MLPKSQMMDRLQHIYNVISKKIPHSLKPFGFQLVRAEGMRERGEGVRKYTTGYPLAKN